MPTDKRLTRAQLLDDMGSQAFGGWRMAIGAFALGIALAGVILLCSVVGK